MPLPKHVRQNIARNLWIMREARGLTRAGVARGLGLSLETVTDFDKGGPLPSAAELRIMCRWYEFPVYNVFKHPNVWRTLH